MAVIALMGLVSSQCTDELDACAVQGRRLDPKTATWWQLVPLGAWALCSLVVGPFHANAHCVGLCTDAVSIWWIGGGGQSGLAGGFVLVARHHHEPPRSPPCRHWPLLIPTVAVPRCGLDAGIGRLRIAGSFLVRAASNLASADFTVYFPPVRSA